MPEKLLTEPCSHKGLAEKGLAGGPLYCTVCRNTGVKSLTPLGKEVRDLVRDMLQQLEDDREDLGVDGCRASVTSSHSLPDWPSKMFGHVRPLPREDNDAENS